MIVVYRNEKNHKCTFNTNNGFELVTGTIKDPNLFIRLANTDIKCPDPIVEFENILSAIEKHQQVYWIKYDST